MGGEEVGSGAVLRNGWVGMSCFGVVTLLLVIREEVLAIKG